VKRPFAPIQPPRSAQGFAQARRAHPLLGAFPLAVMTLATFLVLFTLTMARLNAGEDPAPRPSASLVARSSGAGAVTTRTGDGGDLAAVATQAAAAEESSDAPPVAVSP
jgi:hypothetical protein